jgi:hypothetical protein
MSVRAKFYVGKIDRSKTKQYEKGDDGRYLKNQDGSYREHEVEVANITMHAVVRSVGNTENDLFFAATPGGTLQLYTVNQAAWEQFEVGQEFYLDFTPAGE